MRIWLSTVFILTSLKTEIAKYACEPRWQRALCKRRTGEAPPLAENVGDLITADHEILNEGGESRNNHGQDLATQWIQSYPCKTKTSQETEKRLRKFLEPSEKCKVVLHWQFHWHLANLVKSYHGIVEPEHLIDPRRKVLLRQWYAEY